MRPSARAALEEALHRATGLVARLSLEPGTRVATALANDRDSFALQWALALAGVVEVPLPPATPGPEARVLLEDAAPALLLVDATTGRGVTGAAADAAVRCEPVVLADEAARTPASGAPRTRAMAYTSGTTGRRKGVFAGVHDEGWGHAWLDDESAAFAHRHGPRHLVVSPLHHSGPFRHALVTAHRGGSVSVLPAFDVPAWLEALRTLRPTSMFCVPTQLRRLLDHPAFTPDHLGSLELLLHAGAPCPAPLRERLHAAAPVDAVWEFYGSTEGQFTVCPPAVARVAPGSVGTARPGRTLSVRDERGRPVPDGDVGTVWVTAPTHARWHYWGDPTRTDDAWVDDRFTVGDLGRLDGAGHLTLAGRAGDLVITGGVNVYPAEVEEVLASCPSVAEVAVFGVPDDDWGQRLVAAIVPEADTTIDVPALLAHARAHSSPQRVPKQVHVVGELPRTTTGKVDRSALPELVS